MIVKEINIHTKLYNERNRFYNLSNEFTKVSKKKLIDHYGAFSHPTL